jgi:hypothetical protein
LLPKDTGIKMANYTKRVGNSAVRMTYTDAEIAARIAAEEATGNE